MKVRLAAAASAFVLIVAGGAQAAEVVGGASLGGDPTPGTPLDYMVFNAEAPDSTVLTLETSPGSYGVVYSSDDVLHNTGMGFAQVSGDGTGGGSGFINLTIDPSLPIIGFTAIKFNFEFLDDPPDHKAEAPVTFDTRVNFTNGDFTNILNTVFDGADRYLVVANGGRIMSDIVFSGVEDANGVDFAFKNIKQVSFNAAFAAIPEPATWAMMIGGFAMAGAMIRRRRALPV